VRTREIRRILDEGRAIHGEHVVVFLAKGEDRVAVIAGRKVGKAVQRNRARRVLRMAWRDVRGQVAGDDAVLIARASIVGARSPEIASEIRALLDGAR
jgi:ribonuclease P protein component